MLGFPWFPVDRQIASRVLSFCQDHHYALLIAFTALQFGLLAFKHSMVSAE